MLQEAAAFSTELVLTTSRPNTTLKAEARAAAIAATATVSLPNQRDEMHVEWTGLPSSL